MFAKFALSSWLLKTEWKQHPISRVRPIWVACSPVRRLSRPTFLIHRFLVYRHRRTPVHGASFHVVDSFADAYAVRVHQRNRICSRVRLTDSTHIIFDARRTTSSPANTHATQRVRGAGSSRGGVHAEQRLRGAISSRAGIDVVQHAHDAVCSLANFLTEIRHRGAASSWISTHAAQRIRDACGRRSGSRCLARRRVSDDLRAIFGGSSYASCFV